MKAFTADEEDALREVGNVGMSKAAKQLSIILKSSIKISIPTISLVNLESLTLANPDREKILSFAYQTLTGDLSGYAALVLQREQTKLLTLEVIGQIPKLTEKEIRACEQEALLEIANIIISSCMSALVDMFSTQINLSLPIYDENNLITLLNNLLGFMSEATKNVITITTQFTTSTDQLSGQLYIILNEQSVNTLLIKIKELFNDSL
jgi:chemotaxis protein CheC